MKKTISVIIPTYKRSEFLNRAIDSVLKCKGNYEIIVVDDNDENSEYRKENEKNLSKYIEKGEIIYLKHKKNKNGAAARNTGLKYANGEYVTFLDDDDEFVIGRIEKIESLINKKHPDFICTGVKKKFSNGDIIEFIPNLNIEIESLIYDLFLQKSFVGTGSNIVCKKDLVMKINGFDESFIRHQDIEFLIRYLKECNNIEFIKEILVIKNTEDHLNVPNINKMLEVKNHFFATFLDYIELYDKRKLKKIYYYNYNEVLKSCYMYNDKDNLNNLRKIMKEKKCYSYFYEYSLKLKFFLKKFKLYNVIKKYIVRR